MIYRSWMIPSWLPKETGNVRSPTLVLLLVMRASIQGYLIIVPIVLCERLPPCQVATVSQNGFQDTVSIGERLAAHQQTRYSGTARPRDCFGSSLLIFLLGPCNAHYRARPPPECQGDAAKYRHALMVAHNRKAALYFPKLKVLRPASDACLQLLGG